MISSNSIIQTKDLRKTVVGKKGKGKSETLEAVKRIGLNVATL